MDAELQPVHAGRRSLDAYGPIAGEDAVERVREGARALGGARVAHVTGAAFATAAVDLVRPLVALLGDAGVDARWLVLSGDGDFVHAARALRDGLRGGEMALDDATWSGYVDACDQAVQGLPDDLDCVVVHDPQPLGLAHARSAGDARWVWRTALDVSRPGAGAWDLAAGLLARFDAHVVAHPEFAPPATEAEVLAPGIDPLAPGNLDLSPRDAGLLLRGAGVDLKRPLVCHAARLDGWADVQWSLDAWRRARERAPDLQLVVAGKLAGDDPEGWRSAAELLDEAAGEEGLTVMTNATGLGDAELGAVQRVARVALQASLGGELDLAVSEALWHRTPVVAPDSPGARDQLGDPPAGLLAADARQAGDAIADLVEDPARAIGLGQAGREGVRERFLITRALADEVELLASLAGQGAPAAGH